MNADRLNSRRSLAATGAGSSEYMSPFGVSRLPDSQEKSEPRFGSRKAHRIEVISLPVYLPPDRRRC